MKKLVAFIFSLCLINLGFSAIPDQAKIASAVHFIEMVAQRIIDRDSLGQASTDIPQLSIQTAVKQAGKELQQLDMLLRTTTQPVMHDYKFEFYYFCNELREIQDSVKTINNLKKYHLWCIKRSVLSLRDGVQIAAAAMSPVYKKVSSLMLGHFDALTTALLVVFNEDLLSNDSLWDSIANPLRKVTTDIMSNPFKIVGTAVVIATGVALAMGYKPSLQEAAFIAPYDPPRAVDHAAAVIPYVREVAVLNYDADDRMDVVNRQELRNIAVAGAHRVEDLHVVPQAWLSENCGFHALHNIWCRDQRLPGLLEDVRLCRNSIQQYREVLQQYHAGIPGNINLLARELYSANAPDLVYLIYSCDRLSRFRNYPDLNLVQAFNVHPEELNHFLDGRLEHHPEPLSPRLCIIDNILEQLAALLEHPVEGLGLGDPLRLLKRTVNSFRTPDAAGNYQSHYVMINMAAQGRMGGLGGQHWISAQIDYSAAEGVQIKLMDSSGGNNRQNPWVHFLYWVFAVKDFGADVHAPLIIPAAAGLPAPAIPPAAA